MQQRFICVQSPEWWMPDSVLRAPTNPRKTQPHKIRCMGKRYMGKRAHRVHWGSTRCRRAASCSEGISLSREDASTSTGASCEGVFKGVLRFLGLKNPVTAAGRLRGGSGKQAACAPGGPAAHLSRCLQGAADRPAVCKSRGAAQLLGTQLAFCV